jgi:hypothetical protein
MTTRTLLLAAATALLAATAAYAESPMFSKYTSLTDCRMLYNAANDPAPDMKDVFESICPGRDGLRVMLEGGDARSWIGLLPAGTKYEQGKRLNSGWGGFPEITGKVLEWRYHGSKLVALIVRNEWTEQPETGKVVSGLVIWRVDPNKINAACAIGRTPSNEEAHRIADDLSTPCLESK